MAAGGFQEPTGADTSHLEDESPDGDHGDAYDADHDHDHDHGHSAHEEHAAAPEKPAEPAPRPRDESTDTGPFSFFSWMKK